MLSLLVYIFSVVIWLELVVVVCRLWGVLVLLVVLGLLFVVVMGCWLWRVLVVVVTVGLVWVVVKFWLCVAYGFRMC